MGRRLAEDIDLYAYADKTPSPDDRRPLAAGGRDVEIDYQVWETGDE